MKNIKTNKNYINKVPFLVPTLSQQFNENTKIRSVAKQVPSSRWPITWKEVKFKAYPRLPAIKLPEPSLNPNHSLKESLYSRQSVRYYDKNPLTMREVSNLLYFSCGIRNPNITWTGNRFYPSAGARYPLEVYPIILNTVGLKTGIYHYYLKSHALEELLIKPSIKKEVLELFDAPWIKRSSMIIAISAVFYRNQVKYGERGYRHILAESGHICQNIYLLCPALGLGCCNSGGFPDDKLNSIIDLDGKLESIISVVFVGKHNWRK